MSRTRYALLGILTYGPMTGYDMKQFIDGSIAHFWSESYGNLYPKLRELEADGLIAGRDESRQNAPVAVVYSLTEKGRSAFRDWLAQPSREARPRDELLLRTFFGHEVPPAHTAAQIERYRNQQHAALATFGGIRAELERSHAEHPHQPYWLMTLRRGELVAEARLRWAEECLALLRATTPA